MTSSYVISTHKDGQPVTLVAEHKLGPYLAVLGVPKEYPFIQTDLLLDRELYMLSQGFKVAPLPAFAWSNEQLALFTGRMLKRIEWHASRYEGKDDAVRHFSKGWEINHGQKHTDHIYAVQKRINDYVHRQKAVSEADARLIKSRATYAEHELTEADIDYVCSPFVPLKAETHVSWSRRRTEVARQFSRLPEQPEKTSRRKVTLTQPIVPNYSPQWGASFKNYTPTDINEVFVSLKTNDDADAKMKDDIYSGDDLDSDSDTPYDSESDANSGKDSIAFSQGSGPFRRPPPPRVILPPTPLRGEALPRVRVYPPPPTKPVKPAKEKKKYPSREVKTLNVPKINEDTASGNSSSTASSSTSSIPGSMDPPSKPHVKREPSMKRPAAKSKDDKLDLASDGLGVVTAYCATQDGDVNGAKSKRARLN